MKNKRLIYISIVLFIASLAMPSYIHAAEASFPGIFCLFFGPFGLLFLHFTWLANPFLLMSWISALKKNYAGSIATAIVSLLIALTFPLYKDLPQGSSGIFPFKIQYGYYIWIASIGSMIVINIYLVFNQHNKKKSVEYEKNK
ncbi:hypothetical protein ACFLR3_04080 [Campylobacterota bacterium]